MIRILSILTFMAPILTLAQNSGSVIFEETLQFKIDFAGDTPNNEHIQSLVPTSRSTDKVLHFTPKHTVYKDVEEGKGDETFTDDVGGMDVQIIMKRPENVYYQNLKESLIVQKLDFMDRIFLVSDDMEQMPWKITGERKEILGYICQKATTERDSSKVEVWFTPQIPISSGPSSYGGLPGLILETNRGNGEAVVVAKEIKFDDNVDKFITPPIKGKKVTRMQFKKIREEKLKEMREQFGGNGTRVIIDRN